MSAETGRNMAPAFRDRNAEGRLLSLSLCLLTCNREDVGHGRHWLLSMSHVLNLYYYSIIPFKVASRQWR